MLHSIVIRWCFGFLLLGGLFCLLLGVGAYPPHRVLFQLDAVLTAEEYNDDVKRQATEDLLLRAAGHFWVVLIAAGLFIVALSIIGIWAATVNDEQASVDHGKDHAPR
jgi:hypothetical protein